MGNARLGKYRIRSRLARGGMAEIWLATAHGPEGFSKSVAIKRLLPQLAQRPELVDMFLEEARLAAGLHHPHIVQIFDLGKEGDDHFIAMEYLAGRDLSAILTRVRELGRPVPLEVVAQIASSVAQGLHFAHQHRGADGALREVVHGDITPSNVVVTFVGEVKIVDFGIARAAGAVARAFPGAVQGKPAYLPPEVLAGAPADRMTDVFSLGVVIHELLTGERLFKRDDPEATVKAVREDPVPDPRLKRPEVPAGVAALVMRALEREPGQRPRSTDEFTREIDAWFASSGLVPGPARVARFMADLFGEEGVRAALSGPSSEPTGTATDAGPRQRLVETGLGVEGVRLVTEVGRRGRGFVRVVGEVPAALAKAGHELVAVPLHVVRSAMRWSRPRLVATAALFAMVGFAAGMALRQTDGAARWVPEVALQPPPAERAGTALPVVEHGDSDAGLEEEVDATTRPEVTAPRSWPRARVAKVRNLGQVALSGRGTVYLDGARIGEAPLTRRLAPGTYEVALLDETGRIKGAWIAVVRPGQLTRLKETR